MDFADSPEEAAYRERVRVWLDEHAPRHSVRGANCAPLAEAERLQAARAWQRQKASAGYARVTWPVEWGGGGGTAMQQAIFNQEELRYDVPRGFFGIGLGMCLPTLMKFADADTLRRFVGPALRGEEIWCQLFSEPSAGSDLAGVRTRAVRRGESEWCVNGQKTWTTGAHYADFGLLLARTDASVPKHAGLTMFWIDMKTPGIEVRPIHQMSGGSDFNEVYLSDVLVPDKQRLGGVGNGWKVSLVTLMNERAEGSKDRGPSTEQILELARSVPLGSGCVLDDSDFRQRLASWYVLGEGLRLTRLRTLTALSRGQTPGPESSIGKLVAANRLQELTGQLIDCQGEFGIVSGAPYALSGGSIHEDYLRAPGLRIAGGTDEILKNIIAERVLGLPGDIGVDKNVAFEDLPKGI